MEEHDAVISNCRVTVNNNNIYLYSVHSIKHAHIRFPFCNSSQVIKNINANTVIVNKKCHRHII